MERHMTFMFDPESVLQHKAEMTYTLSTDLANNPLS
jgi:hypothetical protein